MRNGYFFIRRLNSWRWSIALNPRVIARLVLLALPLYSSLGVAAWLDWFQTPDQQAANHFENGDSQSLIDSAPSGDWKGLGHFQAGELDAASRAFEDAQQVADDSGDRSAGQRAMFNNATTKVHNGQLDEAISLFEELLELNPAHKQALHNKEIAEKIREQQQQQDGEQQDGEQQDGEQQAG